MDKGTLIINIGDAEWKIFDVEYSIHYSSGGYGMPDRESKRPTVSGWQTVFKALRGHDWASRELVKYSWFE
tara:strand:- start:20993 stop:21205 length:213 start_codon:yes stop_codon:yes gene_type:complete